MSQDDLHRLWQRLLTAVDGLPEAAWERQFDEVISRSFTLELPPFLDSDRDTFLSKALSLLGRIGQRPHYITEAYGREEDPGPGTSDSSDHRTLVIRIALFVAVSEPGRLYTVSCLRELLNILSELMSTGIDDMDYLFHDADTNFRIFILGIWFPILKLHLWYIVAHHVAGGYDAEWNRFLVLRENSELHRRSILYTKTNMRIPRYMCNWAFRLLLHNRASIALDFRQLFFRFRTFHDGKEARCAGNDPWNSCSGLHPLSCGRFQDKSLVLPEQSVHTEVCNRRWCHRIKWDIGSYDALSGCARAVRIDTADKANTSVTYMGGSGLTMAISHVWSHGHGGRPSTGMNRCLHGRFSDIARRGGCDSYWIDTLSIPEDHTRRKEAIHHINNTFFQAKMVLVVDRDIMSMDIADGHEENGTVIPYTPDTIPIPLLESILATFLVCDWNVRAWTMLEAVKGCRNLHLLCRHGHTLSLQACLRRLVDEGSIDMATMLLVAQHLLPASRGTQQPPSRDLDAAGIALVYRHATRKGDELVIWSLLTNTPPHATAVGFWRSMKGRKIHTGFLVSSIKRLRGIPGFSWAPETPYMRWPERTDPSDWEHSLKTMWQPRIAPSDGSGSRLAEITERGLRGEWLVYRVRPEIDYERAYNVRCAERGNPCLRVASCLTSWAPHVALIDAAVEDGAEHYRGRPLGGGTDTERDGFAVVWSEDGETWRWYGVFPWRFGGERLVMEVKEVVIQ
ncbi:Ankyrin repeat-containing protein [Apiospora hydei]|uniref:Ankyrin repeat-containing protein n=1 Tax=Apiospora hydei TaxID=1337664 RepID=A0ABR1X4Q6_9PEZI